MCLTDIEGKSVIADWFITTLKNKTYKYIPSISKYVYTDKLDDTVNEYKSTYHRTIKIYSGDVTSSIYFDMGIENNEKDPIFKVDD